MSKASYISVGNKVVFRDSNGINTVGTIKEILRVNGLPRYSIKSEDGKLHEQVMYNAKTGASILPRITRLYLYKTSPETELLEEDISVTEETDESERIN